MEEEIVCNRWRDLAGEHIFGVSRKDCSPSRLSEERNCIPRAQSLSQHIPARGCISFPLSQPPVWAVRDVSNEEFFVRDPAVDISFERNVCRLAIGSDPMSRWGRCRRRAHMKEKERARRQDIFQPSSPLTTAQFSFFVL